jgi:transcriptional antiterminator Rof (Rho-off)
MTDTKNHSPAQQTDSLEGRFFQPQSMADLEEAIELAFDYRGDVTIKLKSGHSIDGYLFNREVRETGSWLEVFPADRPDIVRLRYDEVSAIAFTGEDTASGHTWEAWVAKKGSERKAEADRLAAEAKARGHL